MKQQFHRNRCNGNKNNNIINIKQQPLQHTTTLEIAKSNLKHNNQAGTTTIITVTPTRASPNRNNMVKRVNNNYNHVVKK